MRSTKANVSKSRICFVGDEATPFTPIVSRENKNYRQVDLPIIFDRLRSVVVVVVGKDIGILCRERLFMFSCVFIRSLHLKSLALSQMCIYYDFLLSVKLPRMPHDDLVLVSRRLSRLA